MTKVRTIATFALLALAACASSNSQEGAYRPDIRNRGPLVLPASAAELALNDGAELALTTEQRKTLEQIRRDVDAANAPLRVQLDSLRPSSRPVNSRDMSEEQREEMRARRTAVQAVVGKMRDNVAAARARTFAILSTEQKQRVEALEAEARKRSDEEMNRVGRSDDADARRRGGRQPED